MRRRSSTGDKPGYYPRVKPNWASGCDDTTGDIQNEGPETKSEGLEIMTTLGQRSPALQVAKGN